MSKIPCKKCNSCGFYHDLSVMTCDECGTDLKNIPALMIETEDIPGEKYGEIDENVTVFVQKCSACGALNFTADKDSPVKVCHNCHKTRVASIDPEEYVENVEGVHTDDDMLDDGEVDTSGGVTQTETGSGTAKVLFDDDDDDDDEDSVQWQGILGNIRKSVGGAEPNPSRKVEEKKKIVQPPVTDTDDDDDDDDDDGISDWSGILGGSPAPKKVVAEQHKPSITLTAVRYGRLSFTIETKDGEYMLGRSANQSEFLRSDGRVGNEHCYLYFKNGSWYVKDNHSSNGTAVNSRDLGLNGESRLNDGDELKLGHHPDSMAFKITIR